MHVSFFSESKTFVRSARCFLALHVCRGKTSTGQNHYWKLKWHSRWCAKTKIHPSTWQDVTLGYFEKSSVDQHWMTVIFGYQQQTTDEQPTRCRLNQHVQLRFLTVTSTSFKTPLHEKHHYCITNHTYCCKGEEGIRDKHGT